MPETLFALGGARSGKSRYAAAWILAQGGSPTYLATAAAADAEMEVRIARHRQDRASQGWTTVEEQHDVLGVLQAATGPVLVDCATLWLTNRAFVHAWSEALVLSEVDALCEWLKKPAAPVAVVSNEVGQGVVPATELGRRFADLQGFANQRLAAACARVELLVAGIPVRIK
jgi:adenosylcobinamide kinase / adenosylcobinamide-phosphate guanylyltransferase